MSQAKTQSLDLKKFLPYRFSVLEQQISEKIAQQYCKQFNLNRMEWRVMSTLAMFNNITARDVCEFTHMEKMQVSRAIRGLDTKNLVDQRKDSQDHRRCVLSLTKSGLKIYHQIVPRVLAAEAELFSSFTKDELKAFHQLIHKLCLSLEF